MSYAHLFTDHTHANKQDASTSTKNDTPAPARPPTAVVGSENMMPRFWVLTDHARREVVLVIRGTMSLNEVAVDLTCDPAPFELHSFPSSAGTTCSDRGPTHASYFQEGQNPHIQCARTKMVASGVAAIVPPQREEYRPRRQAL